MNSSIRGDGGQQKLGGFAALYLAAAFIAAMPYFLLLVNYPRVVDPAEKVALLAGNLGSMTAMYLVTYVFFGIVLAVLALALYARMRDRAPFLAQTATAVGLIWAFVLVASGMVFNAGMVAVVGLYGANPVQAAAAWQAIEPVAQGLGGSGGELLGGLWVLLVSVAGLLTRALPKAELARSGDRHGRRPLGRAGDPGLEVWLRAGAHRVVRVARDRPIAHEDPDG